MTGTLGTSRWVAPAALAVLLLAGIGLRVAALGLPGHSGDLGVMSRWAEHMAEFGPWGFYEHDGAVYPALLYAYWPLGVVFDGPALTGWIKALSIPFDVLIGVVVYLAARRMVGGRRALIAPAVYLLNPAVVLAGPVWGQVDAAGSVAYLGALLAVAGGRFGWAGALAALATLMKPQFGLVALPIAVLAMVAWRATRSYAPMARALVGGALAYLAVAVPLRLDPISFVGRALSIASDKPWTSANAPNLWGVLIGYKVPDGQYVVFGGALLLLGIAAALLPLRRRQNLATILAVGLFLVLAFYLLPTRIHERYLFPAMAILAPLAATSWRVLVAALFVTAAFATALLYGLVSTTSFSLPTVELETLLLSRGAIIGIGLTLMASTAALVVFLWPPPRSMAQQR